MSIALTQLEKAYVATGILEYIISETEKGHEIIIGPTALQRLKDLRTAVVGLHTEHKEGCDGSCKEIHPTQRFSLVTTGDCRIDHGAMLKHCPDHPVRIAPKAVAFVDGTELTDSYFYRGVRISVGEKQDGTIVYCTIIDDQIRTSSVFRELELLIDDSLPDRLIRHNDEQVEHK